MGPLTSSQTLAVDCSGRFDFNHARCLIVCTSDHCLISSCDGKCCGARLCLCTHRREFAEDRSRRPAASSALLRPATPTHPRPSLDSNQHYPFRIAGDSSHTRQSDPPPHPTPPRIRSGAMLDPPLSAAAAAAAASLSAAATAGAASTPAADSPLPHSSGSLLVPPDFPLASLLSWLQSHLVPAFFLLLGVGSVAWLIGFNFYLTKAVCATQTSKPRRVRAERISFESRQLSGGRILPRLRLTSTEGEDATSSARADSLLTHSRLIF